MTTELVVKQDTRICQKCWQNCGRSGWAVGHPLFERLCKACWGPIRQAMLAPNPRPVMTCDIPS